MWFLVLYCCCYIYCVVVECSNMNLIHFGFHTDFTSFHARNL